MKLLIRHIVFSMFLPGLMALPRQAVAAVVVNCPIADYTGLPTGCNLTPWPACQVQCTLGSPGHGAETSVLQVTNLTAGSVTDAGGWIYDNGRSDTAFGQIEVNCSHPDLKNIAWYTY